MMPGLAGLAAHHLSGKSATIIPAENGFIVSTIHEVEVEMPREDEITGEGWKGGKKFTHSVPKNNVFTDIADALKHIETYMNDKE